MDATDKPLKVGTTNPDVNIAKTVRDNPNIEIHPISPKK
jgi:hypothetical protein